MGAPKLLVLHGYGDTIFSWTGWLLWLGKRFHVFALDFPGSQGMSPLPKSGAPVLDDHVATVEELLATRVGRTDFILSNSMGGWVALRVASRQADRVGHVIALNPGGAFTNEKDALHAYALFQVESYADYIRLMSHLWHKVPVAFYPASVLGLYQFTRRPEFTVLPSAVERSHFLNEVLPSLRVPVSVVWGTGDRLFPESMGRLIAELAPNGTYHPIERAGHMPQLERPRELARILNQIFTRASTR